MSNAPAPMTARQALAIASEAYNALQADPFVSHTTETCEALETLRREAGRGSWRGDHLRKIENGIEVLGFLM